MATTPMCQACGVKLATGVYEHATTHERAAFCGTRCSLIGPLFAEPPCNKAEPLDQPERHSPLLALFSPSHNKPSPAAPSATTEQSPAPEAPPLAAPQASAGPQDAKARSAGASVRARARALWEAHGRLTRAFIVAYLDAARDDTAAVAMATAALMQNQEDLGAFIDTLVAGTRAAATRLLKEHILGAAAILAAVKHGRAQDDVYALIYAWHENGREISTALAPGLGLTFDVLNRHMFNHLTSTLAEATLHTDPPSRAELAMYADVQRHLRMMADLMVSQFAEK